MDNMENILAENSRKVPCGCWEWTGKMSRYGYPLYKGNLMHRLIVGLTTGDGLNSDHLCNNPTCVNPAHLEVVTKEVNQIRRRVRNRLQPWADHCVRGHVMDDLNTWWRGNGTGRQCRTCQRERQWEYQVRTQGCKTTAPPKLGPNTSLKYKDLYMVDDKLMAKAGLSWDDVKNMCNHSEGSSKAITTGKPKTVTLLGTKL